MPLRALRTVQYRAFAGDTHLEVRPLTLLFGYNSAGKSALLRAFPLVAESIVSATGPLSLGGTAARGGGFFDVRTRWSVGAPEIRFGLDWDDGAVDVNIQHHASMQRQVVDRMSWRDQTGRATTFELDIEDERAVDISPYRCGDEHGHIEFQGWLPVRVEGFSQGDLLRHAGERLREYSASVHWLGSLRSPPPRTFGLIGTRSRLSVSGVEAGEVLARDSLSKNREVLSIVDRWYRAATRHELGVQSQASAMGQQQFFLTLRPLQAPAGVHLSDTGEGMTQVLPVITLGALALAGRLGPTPLLAIEQPELHLHPRAHEHVANFLIEVSTGASVVVETHSENFLLAVQVAIASGRIAPEDVIVHWVRSTDEGPSYVEPIRFDRQARPSMWPDDVFAEDHALKRKVLELRHGVEEP